MINDNAYFYIHLLVPCPQCRKHQSTQLLQTQGGKCNLSYSNMDAKRAIFRQYSRGIIKET